MTPTSPTNSTDTPSVITKTIGACIQCKNKKLKCDKRARSCRNCHRTQATCIGIDAVSGRQYERSYIDDLHARAQELRANVANLTSQREYLPVAATSDETVPRQNSTPEHQPRQAVRYGEIGSVFSLGQLVAAAVSKASDKSMRRMGASLAREQRSVEKIKAQHAVLPPHNVALELIASYFNSLHVVMPFLRRKDIYSQLERLYSGRPTYNSTEKAQDLFQINMVFATGALHLSDRNLAHQHPKDYYATAMEQEGKQGMLSGAAKVQNVLLVFIFTTQHDVGIASHWDIIRQAMRVCIEWGFHRSTPGCSSLVEEQLRRRIFWSVYISDRHYSQNLGRPIAIGEHDITIELPFHVDDDDLAEGTISSPRDYSEVSILIRHILLRRLGTRARSELTKTTRLGARLSLQEKIEVVNKWDAALQEWLNSMVVAAYPTNAYETVEYLHINFHRERIKLLSHLILSTESDGPNLQQTSLELTHLQQTLASASRVLACYQAQATTGLLITNWTMQIPLRYHQNGSNTGVINKDDVITMLEAIRTCQEILNSISSQWKTVTPHRKAFERLSQEVVKLLERSAVPNPGLHNGNSGNDSGDEHQHVMWTNDSGVIAQAESMEWDFDLFNQSFQSRPPGNMGFTDTELNELFGLEINNGDLLSFDYSMGFELNI